MPHDSIEHVRTARLTLTRIAEHDWPDFRRMHQDPRVMATLGGVKSETETRALFDRFVRQWLDSGIGWWAARDERGEFVGRGGVRRVQIEGMPELEMGYGLVADAWGQGLATELALEAVRVAFARLGTPSVCAFTLPSNAASRRVMEKTGMRYERDLVYAGLSHVLYRVTRDEWLAEAAPARLR